MSEDIIEEFTNDIKDNELQHYGTPQLYPGDPHGSGRYREGSGGNPDQHGSDDFIERISQLRKSGMSEREIWALLLRFFTSPPAIPQ